MSSLVRHSPMARNTMTDTTATPPAPIIEPPTVPAAMITSQPLLSFRSSLSSRRSGVSTVVGRPGTTMRSVPPHWISVKRQPMSMPHTPPAMMAPNATILARGEGSAVGV